MRPCRDVAPSYLSISLIFLADSRRGIETRAVEREYKKGRGEGGCRVVN